MDSVKEYFDSQAPDWATRYSERPDYLERKRVFREFIRGEIAKANICSVLEVGCGAFSMFPARWYPDIDYFATDISYDMLARNDSGGVRFQGDFLNMPIQGQFDMVILSSVLEWLKDPGKAPELCAQLIASGRSLLVSYPNDHSVLRMLERHVLQPVKALGSGRHNRSLQTRAECKTLQKEFEACGFQLESIAYFGKKLVMKGRLSSAMRLDLYRKS